MSVGGDLVSYEEGTQDGRRIVACRSCDGEHPPGHPCGNPCPPVSK